MTDTTIPRVRITSPTDLVASIPALLGFQPNESLVVLLIGDDRALRCTMRIDLSEGIASQTDRITEVARRASAATVVVAVYSHEPRTAWEIDVRQVAEALHAQGLEVTDALYVDGGRFWSFLCATESCCPAGGREIPTGVPVLEAHRVVQGQLAVHDSREALESAYRPRPDLAPLTAVYDRQEAALALPLEERCAQALSDAHELMEVSQDQDRITVPDEVRARLSLLLHDSTVRDLVLATLAQAEDLRPAARALTWLALTSAEAVRGPAAASAAFLHVATGNPVACWALVELAPDESLARLVRLGMEQGVPPEQARRVLVETLPAIQERLARS